MPLDEPAGETLHVFIDVSVPEEERPHDDWFVRLLDQLVCDHLLADTIRDPREVLLLQVEEHHARFEASPQVQKRVKAQGGDVWPTPPVRPFLQVFLILYPAGRLFPFALFTRSG